MENAKESSIGSKIARIIGIILCVLVLVFIAFMIGEKIIFSSFYSNAQKEFRTPGTKDGFVGQGFDYYEEKDLYLSCGYMTKSSQASRIYITDCDGNSRYTELKNSDGTNYTGHTGGISFFDGYVYITGDDGLDVFPLEDVLNEEVKEVKQIGEVKTGNDPAYCCIYDGMIYVGTFYDGGKYVTPEHEWIETPAGDKNYSVCLVFGLDKNAEYGIGEVSFAYSTPNKAQGMCITDDGRMVISTSYGLSKSALYVYEIKETQSGEYETNGKMVPLYCLDSDNYEKTITAPPMSEELIYKDGKIYIMNESASNKYKFGKFTSGNYVWSYNYK